MISISDNVPSMYRIENIVEESSKAKTFIFRGSIIAKPGQFVMVWLPGIDSKPMSVSYRDRKRFGITVNCVGKFTNALSSLKIGHDVGIQGPYGHGFSIRTEHRRALCIGGGCGTAPIAYLSEMLSLEKKDLSVIIGAKTAEEILFADRISTLKGVEFSICTDDGSAGRKGTVIDCFRSHIEDELPDIVYCCGPEMMIKAAFDVCRLNKIPIEASLERYMKCAIGICGSCAIDDRLVCKDGPVFDGASLEKLEELGKFKRDSSGKLIPV